jgi:transcription elongation GreA/GreB family factor
MTQAIKQQLYSLCREYVEKRIRSSRDAIAEAQQSANEETKRSSGDKYETGRAMMQLEIEKNSRQLSESLKLKNALDQIRLDISASSVQPGSLVVTDREVFFVAISLGKIEFEGKTYFVIAPASPLGLELVGAKVGDRVTFRNESYLVQDIR